MSHTFEWCLDKTRLTIYDKQVFCVDQCGTKYWFLNGKRHRINGPAIEYANGTKWWYLNGKYHRLGGPAIEYACGYRRWYLNGKKYSESAYWKEVKE